jgi:hypothetical protein
MINDKYILTDFIVSELSWAIKSSEGDSERHRSNVQYHMERTLGYIEELINVLADQFGEEMDNESVS